MGVGARVVAAATRLALGLEPVLRRVRPAVGDTLPARRVAAAELAAWGRRRRPGPLVWLHGASAGELLGAAPAIRLLRARAGGGGDRRAPQLLVTHFSPSGRAAIEHLDADYAGYPPLELPGDCRQAVGAVRPGLLLFAKLDVWPGLAAAAKRAGTPVALINGTVRSGSRRSAPVARRLFRGCYASLDIVGAATPPDARRLEALGVREERLEVTGDGSFDLALERADNAVRSGAAAEFRRWLSPPDGADRRRLIAGSTWPADESALLEAVAAPPAPGPLPGWQMVIVPHDPSEQRVRSVAELCAARGRRAVRWSEIAVPATLPADAIVIFDEAGRLAELYTSGDAAYVGGGIGGTGLHSVLEPAAAGLPVLFGPNHDRDDARGLQTAGGGLAAAATSLREALASMEAESVRSSVGQAARSYVEAGAGGAERTARLLSRIWRPA